MQRLLMSVATAVVLTSAHYASAADLPVKAPAYQAPAVFAPPPTWTGWYFGAAGGYGWGHAEQTDATPFDSGRYRTHGGIFGATLGYNWQSGPTVLGLETDLSWAGIQGSTQGTLAAFGNCGGAGAGNCNSEIRALGTVRARLGWAWQAWMPYVTGGWAYGKVHGSEGDVAANGAFGSGSKWVGGWTLGGGVEAKFAPNWSAKLEYLYVNLGNKQIFNDNIAGAIVPQNLKVTAQILRLGVNYHF